MEQLKISELLLAREGVEMLVLGEKMKKYKWQIMRDVGTPALLLTCYPQLWWWPSSRQEGCMAQGDTALCPKYPVLETKSSGVKQFCWEESLQICIRDQALKLSIKILYVPTLLPCSVLMHTVCPGLPLRSRSHILNLSLWRPHLSSLFPVGQLSPTMELLFKKSKLL